MREWFVDLHIHIGRSSDGQPVKISGARNLTFANIAREASERKGIDVIGIIDCASPPVQQDIHAMLQRGEMEEVAGGGLKFGNTTVLLGAELEVRDPGLGPAHLLFYLPTLSAMEQFSQEIGKYMKNISLSSQRVYLTARDLQAEVISRGGFVIPAHIFTPHKGLYGNACDRMEELLDPEHVAAVELGLSSDSTMAGYIRELAPFTFVTNSDAHSLVKIGREYNQMRMAEPTFDEVRRSLLRLDGRAVTANYGLSPRLGKYHRSYCLACQHVLDSAEMHVEACPACGSTSLTRGVHDRIRELADVQEPLWPPHRPPYIEQIPLEFIPGLGARTMGRLLERFGTEMNILHRATEEQLAEVVSEELARAIMLAREGTLELVSGGGGIYGKVKL
jgi:uncharacterized protein (TIGR00375 family)